MSDFYKLSLLTLVCVSLLALVWYRAHEVSTSAVGEEMTKPVPPAETPRSYFEPLIAWQLGNKPVFASVAATSETRTLGLSYTSALPADIVKVFVFDTDERWSFWMKEMRYAIDIAWVSASGTIIYIEPNISPATYPKSFTPPLPARYVIETVPGFWSATELQVGDTINLEPIIDNIN